MPVANAEVAAVFDEIADLLELQNANVFRIRAYRRAARQIESLGRSVNAMVEQGEDLDALPGIGRDLAGKIIEIVATGGCALLERLRKELPTGMTELLKLPGLGARRVRVLHDELGITSLEQLHRAARQGLVRTVHGFGIRSEQNLLAAAAAHLQQSRRVKLPLAAGVAQKLLAELAAVQGVRQAVAAGSLRRQRETVGDVDLLVAMQRGSAIMERFVETSGVQRVLSKGATRSSVLLGSGLQVDLRAVASASFGAAWLYFTGSKAHNIALRRLAQAKGLKLNEYGLYRGSRRIAGETEASVYEALGLDYIGPELREDNGEIEAAQAHRLPHLVQLQDLRGDLHAHTTDSDGTGSLEAMAAAARARGLQYLAITDHTRGSGLPHALDADALTRQIDRIDELNVQLKDVVLLKGVEAEILEDGRLDLPDALLRRLDLVVGAVHHRFGLSRERQTERLLRAMDRPCFSILAHPFTRLIDERPAADVDLQRVLRKAHERGCFVELNSQPSRLDLPAAACRMAHDESVLVSVASDAHGIGELDFLNLGIGQARRGWLSAADVLNARDLSQLRPLLEACMGRGRRAATAAAAAPAAAAAT